MRQLLWKVEKKSSQSRRTTKTKSRKAKKDNSTNSENSNNKDYTVAMHKAISDIKILRVSGVEEALLLGMVPFKTG